MYGDHILPGFADELVKLAGGVPPPLQTPSTGQRSAAPMKAPSSEFVGPTSAYQKAIPTQVMQSPQRQPAPSTWRPSPGVAPAPAQAAATPAPASGGGGKAHGPGGPLRDRMPYEAFGDYWKRKGSEGPGPGGNWTPPKATFNKVRPGGDARLTLHPSGQFAGGGPK